MYDASISPVAHNCHSKSNLVRSLLIFIRNFTIVNIQYKIDTGQKKHVSTILTCNLEMKSPTVFCLAEVSLVCFD